MCYRCAKKEEREREGKKRRDELDPCKKCGKMFTVRTLDTWNGMCAKCYKGKSEKPKVRRTREEPKYRCMGVCGNHYTKKTLEPRGWLCYRCELKVKKGEIKKPEVKEEPQPVIVPGDE